MNFYLLTIKFIFLFGSVFTGLQAIQAINATPARYLK